MGDLLKTVKTTKKVQSNIERFESLTLSENRTRSRSNSRAKSRPIIEVDAESEPVPLLTAISTKVVEHPRDREPADSTTSLHHLKPVIATHKKRDSAVFLKKHYLKDTPAPSLADDAREILRSQPDIEDVEAVLEYLQYGIEGQHDFNVRITGPKQSLLVRVLVASTIPDLWPNLNMSRSSASTRRMKGTLLQSLFSIAGIEAILEHLRTFTKSSSNVNKDAIRIYVDFLGSLLHGSDVVCRFLSDMTTLYDKEVQRRLFWQGVTSLLAGSKVLSTLGYVQSAIAEFSIEQGIPDWLLRGADYSEWLARNISKAAIELSKDNKKSWSNLGALFKRSLSLGYRGVFIAKVYTSLLLGQAALWPPLHHLLDSLPPHDQKVVFGCILDDLTRSYFTNFQNLPVSTTDTTTAKAIAGAAALINGLTSHNEYLLECAIDWASTSGGANAGEPGLRRALITVLAQSQDKLERILERTLTSFSDKLRIQADPIVQQDHLAQTLLLVIGYLHRQNHASLKENPIPLLVMNAISNRLASTVPRTRLLGMIVGTAMSQFVDEPTKVLNFDTPDMDMEEVKEMLALTKIEDKIGSLDDLRVPTNSKNHDGKVSRKSRIAAQKPGKVEKEEPATTSRIIAIEEVSSSTDDEDDLVPYQKPVDDPEDEDEDPTLINREKPKAPIYIADLIKQLQLPPDKLEVVSLALKTASGLIRRKASFGTELSDNIHSLASALINLQDGMSKSEHQQERLDALIACLVAQPEQMGKYLANTYFNGDFSLSQRSTLLIAIGLGSRELAGFAGVDTRPPSEQADTFPSQRLPPHLQPKPLTATTPKKPVPQKRSLNQISMLTQTATQDIIRPLALAAAETQSGPSILQLNKSSSRVNASFAKKSSQQPQTNKPIPRNIHAILTNNIYLPLCSPLSAILLYTSTPTGRSTNTTLFFPSTLTLHLQTLTLLLHTLGPTGLSPPSIFTSILHETLLLLTHLSRNPKLSMDGIVLPASLGLFLALIDITVEIGVTAQERLLADPFGVLVSELVRWTGGLEGRNGVPTPSVEGKGEGGVAWTVLAAAIQVRWYEIGRRFQGRMMGLDLDD